MSFSLVNNLGSIDSQGKLNITGAKLNQAIQRLSSGLRINMSGDDAAGLAIANKYRSDVSVLTQGVRNANDGLSTLQVIDGGLNTISGLLDRAGVLAAQSASDTFSGDRNTLQSEFSKVMAEITRQAQSIGLVSGGTNNKALTTVIGGGSDTFAATNSNNGVQIDLSGAGNRVDATSLGLSGLSIGTGNGNITGAQDISGGITATEVLSFGYVDSSGALATRTVSLSAGSSAANVVDAINSDSTLSQYGITASIDSNGKLVLTSPKFFTVSSDTADGASQTGIAGAGAAVDDVAVTGGANAVSKTISGGAASGTETLSFTGSEIGYANTAKNVSFSNAVAAAGAGLIAQAGAVADSVNNDSALRAAGVFAIQSKADGSQVTFVSMKNFNMAISSSVGAVNATNNIDALQTATAATGATLTGGAAGAKSALDALKTAVATLGTVQGTVGAGENRLLQAMDLASAQITNFQAAESRVRDADVAAEASNMARLTVLQQAGVAALAQANQSSQAVLSLLR